MSPLRDEIDRLEERFASREPEVLSFVPEEGRFDRLRREAEELETRWPHPAERPPFFGVPVGVKDIFHVDGLPTQAGSRLPPEAFHGPESIAVTALKAAGALIAGKTVTTEFAYLAPGPTRNPVNPEHTPGGSSSGSAAAVGADLVPLTLGTQQIGSITRPAAFCGVVGFKPSYDRIARAGVLPLAPSVDHLGVFARDLDLVSRVAAVLVEGWRPWTPGRRPVLGLPEGPYLSIPSAEGTAHFQGTCDRLRAKGFEIRPVEVMPDIAEIVNRHGRLLAAEAARVHAERLLRFRNLLAPQTIELLERGARIGDSEIERDRAAQGALRDELGQAMERNGIDLWISPAAAGPAPLGLSSTGDPRMNLPWTQAGLPTVGFPSGWSAAGLPLGLQLTGRWWRDEEMLAFAPALAGALQG